MDKMEFLKFGGCHAYTKYYHYYFMYVHVT